MRARKLVAAVLSLSLLLLPTGVSAQSPTGEAGCVGLESQIQGAPLVSILQSLLQGCAGAFDPVGPLARAQTAALVTRLFALQPPAQPAAFADVPTSNWAYQDIEAAAPDMTQFQLPGGMARAGRAPAGRRLGTGRNPS
jgi:hypothetical protein